MERSKQQKQPSPHEDDVYGQYASDYAGSATNDVPDDFTGTLSARAMDQSVFMAQIAYLMSSVPLLMRPMVTLLARRPS